MGYTTEFKGTFALDKPLTTAHAEYLRAFAGTRRMRGDVRALATAPDPKREAVGLPLGDEGQFYVGSEENFGQRANGVANYNEPPAGQPGLWCQWVPTDDNMGIAWDDGEKFYSYEEWLIYLVEKFLKPWGYVLNGRVLWRGEDDDDRGVLVATDNVITTVRV